MNLVFHHYCCTSILSNTIHLTDNKNFVMPKSYSSLQWLHPYHPFHWIQLDRLCLNLKSVYLKGDNLFCIEIINIPAPCITIPKLFILCAHNNWWGDLQQSHLGYKKMRRCRIAWLMSVDLHIEYHIFVMQGTPFNIPLALQLFYPSMKCFIKKRCANFDI